MSSPAVRRQAAFIVEMWSRAGARVTATELVAAHGVHVRTIYRDVATLLAADVPIHSEPGVGYRFRWTAPLPGVELPLHEAVAFLALLDDGYPSSRALPFAHPAVRLAIETAARGVRR